MVRGKFILNCCLLLLICIAVGGGLITVANYLPINSEIKNASIEEIQGEGLFPEVPSMEGGYGNFHSMNPTALELATDSLMLKMALYEGEGAGIEQAFRCYSTQYEEEYSRYWHGYVTVLRPLLLLFDYYEIRIINGICQCLLLFAVAFYVWKQKGLKYALAVLSSYILLMPMALAHCLQYSWAFYVSFGFLLIYLRWRSYWNQGNRYVYFFILTGAVTIYLDLLTYPLLTWGLNIIWYILLWDTGSACSDNGSKGNGIWQYVRRVVCSGFAWIIGYGGMWIGKWALGSLVLRENLFKKAVSEALLWTVNDGEQPITMTERLYSVFKNWSVYEYKIYVIILAAWLLYWVGRGLFFRCDKNVKTPALLLTASSSIVWYMTLAGHSLMHHIFTHRTFGITIAAFLGIILVSTENKAALNKKIVSYVKRIAVLAGAGIMSFALVFLLRDEYLSYNGTHGNFEKIKVGDIVYADFTPAFSDVIKLYLGVSVEEGTEGYYRILLTDQDSILDQIELPIEECGAGNWHSVPVNWQLQAGHTYRLSIEPVDNDGVVYQWVTSDGELPIAEFGKTSIGKTGGMGQMLTGVSYWCVPQARSVRFFFMVTFWGMCMMILIACWSVLGRKRCHENAGEAK